MSLYKDLQEVASNLVLDLLDLWLIVQEDDDETEDHSLIELAGDMLEEIFEDIKYAETAEFPEVILFLAAVFEGVLSVVPRGGCLKFLSPIFFRTAAE